MAVMALCAVLGIAVPILLSWWIVKKYNVRPLTIIIGALVFVVFALVLEALMHQIVLKGPHGPAITGNIMYYALYGGLAAGIFEETGRFLAMKFFLKREPSSAITGIGYGIGHGGVEMLVIFGVTMLSNIAISAMINAGQIDTVLASVPAENLATVQAQFDGLKDIAPGTLLIGLWERASALILQISLSLLVWVAVRRGGKWLWLFPAAILLHALVDAAAVILSKSVGMVSIEIIISALAVAVGAMGWMVAKKL